MFFQAQTPPTENDIKIGQRYSEVLKQIAQDFIKLTNPIGAATSKFEDLTLNAEALNRSFLGTRARLQEMLGAINETVPRLSKMGATYDEAAKTIAEIASGSRRNIIATTDDVAKLYAAGQLIGKSVKEIVNDFANAGYSYDKISDNIRDSISYVQNLGQNARTVMKDVVDNTEKLSRYNFSEGVMGLTKMAAQASLLRFDMKDTFELAEGLFRPERAIEVASAFQRLGVSVGNLANPFDLMQQSIMDPSGLQDSLINLAKSFTYFDEKTKSFKINPQGIITLKELQDSTGINAENMRRSALAAAEMDVKLARINTTAFRMPVSDDDKKLIANIARMGSGEGADYEVTIKDEKGNEYQRKLVDLQEDDFQKLIEQQKKAPISLEELQQKQLTTSELLLAEFRTLKETLVSSLVGLPGMTTNIEQGIKSMRDFSGSISGMFEKVGAKKEFETISENLREIAKIEDPVERKKRQQEQYEYAEKYLKGLGDVFETNARRAFQQMTAQNDVVTNDLRSQFGDLFSAQGRKNIMEGDLGPERRAGGGPVMNNRAYIIGEEGPELFAPKVSGTILPTTTTTSLISNLAGAEQKKFDVNINFPNSLKIDWNVDIPNGVDQRFVEAALTPAGKQAIFKAWQEQAYELGKVASKAIIPGLQT